MNPSFLDKDEPGPNAIPARDQVRLEDTWDLTALYATPQDWQANFEKLRQTYERIAQWKGRVGESARTLREVLEFEKSLGLLIERLYHYASLKCSEDSSNADNLAREGQLENLLTRVNASQAFVEPEIMAIGDPVFEALLKEPVLAEWITPLRKRRRLKPHTLGVAEERLLALGSSALTGQRETFSQLTNVDMKFGAITDEKGEERPLSQSSWISFLTRRDAALRRRTFHQFYAEFDDHRFTLASTLATSIKADVFRARSRNYPSALESALFYDDVPVSVYDNLIASVRANLAPLLRYYALRKRVLGLGEIHQYDTYVPIVADIDTRVSFDEAIEKVIAALAPLGGEYCRVLADGLRRQRWCDRYESKGKRSGAFSSSSYRNPPFMLMNYKEDVFSDIYTLAHEAGHSMHTWFAQQTQPFQTYDYPIFLAEVASTFNEELLTHHLLETTDDPKMRAYLINRQIDDIRGTVYRQTMFAEFEKLIHAMEERGEPLTIDTFRQAYRSLLDAYFGPDLIIDSELELECLRIPHFYSAFYVYKYATGISAAVALSEQVLGEDAEGRNQKPEIRSQRSEVGDQSRALRDGAAGEGGRLNPEAGARGSAVERYLGFLRAGGSKFPIPTLQDAGVDMSSPAPVEATLRLFARRVEELEALLG